ncbi:MAG: class I SAM-dependent methyltransferase [Methanoregula sp.]|nr:class I SAM-dependent methyltransferase [Methanoregula sp.]
MSENPHICRSCGSDALKPIISLGDQPLANALRTEKDLPIPQKKYPLELVFCPNCSLVQITETVNPEELFSEYLYFSSYSDTMLRHAQSLSARITEKYHLSNDSLVIEIASNDGYLLQYFKKGGIPVLGIDPAKNIVKVAEEKGIPTKCAFFNLETARELRNEGKTGDILLGLNVLAHLADLSGFIEGVKILLKENGTAVFEVPYVRDMITRNEFDTIYHEHLYYYSLISLRNLFKNHNLEIVDAEQVPVHGGSLRVFVQHHKASIHPSTRLESLLAEEYEVGLDKLRYYEEFGREVTHLKADTLTLLAELKSRGKTIVAYGAAAKGSTLLNYYGITKETIDYIGDRSPYKQGKYLPGTQIPIVSPDTIAETKPDYIFILPWNLKDEIMDQLKYIKGWGGHYIIPIPRIQVI